MGGRVGTKPGDLSSSARRDRRCANPSQAPTPILARRLLILSLQNIPHKKIISRPKYMLPPNRHLHIPLRDIIMTQTLKVPPFIFKLPFMVFIINARLAMHAFFLPRVPASLLLFVVDVVDHPVVLVLFLPAFWDVVAGLVAEDSGVFPLGYFGDVVWGREVPRHIAISSRTRYGTNRDPLFYFDISRYLLK